MTLKEINLRKYSVILLDELIQTTINRKLFTDVRIRLWNIKDNFYPIISETRVSLKKLYAVILKFFSQINFYANDYNANVAVSCLHHKFVSRNLRSVKINNLFIFQYLSFTAATTFYNTY